MCLGEVLFTLTTFWLSFSSKKLNTVQGDTTVYFQAHLSVTTRCLSERAKAAPGRACLSERAKAGRACLSEQA